MGVKRYQDLVAWKLARELERRVFAFSAKTPTTHDFDFCRQVRRSSSSASRNIVEGFGRFSPLEFARFLRIARGELLETSDHLEKAFELNDIGSDEHAELTSLASRAVGATTRLVVYLESCTAGRNRHVRRRKRGL